MFRLIKKAFIRLLSFTGSLETKYVSLNTELCMTRPTLINLISIKFNYHLYMIIYINVMEVARLLMAYLIICFK